MKIHRLAWIAAMFMSAIVRGDDGPAVKPLTTEERSHWAFQPPKKVAAPLPGHVVDAFVERDLKAVDLDLGPEADRSTLLRRLSFDLIGLPPTAAEVEAFLKDERPDAYERQVDRLLNSPMFGVRQGQHWLDLARYADSDGFEFDQARPDAWRYRDWVVDAFNRNMPYARFVAEQLAGDELEPDSSSAFVATGFNRCYPDMVDLNDQVLRRQNALNDMTDTAGLVFMGLTLGCAKCHDHKTDPIRQHDYYRLQSVFTPARFRDDYPIAPPAERSNHERATRLHREEAARLQAAILAIETPVRERLTPNPAGAVADDVIAAMAKTPSERTPVEVGLVYDLWAKDKRIKPDAWERQLGPETAAERADLLKRLAAHLRKPPPALPSARGLDETGREKPKTYLLIRGELTRKGPAVEPGVPAVLPSAGFAPERVGSSSGRRLALAKWLTRPDHPLTARVAVNRIWQTHYGRGIVSTPSDFGKGGAEPTHPELLDRLALAFVEGGWNVKEMHRLIVTSRTYRQSSLSRPEAAAVDPENSLFWRQNRKRLDGEALRDALLAVAGRLNPELGGPPVFPELPAELTKLSGKGEAWPVSKSRAEREKRSLYVFVRRNLRYPLFEVFDRPDTNASCARRPVSTIAPQALALFNGKLAQDLAADFAGRIKAVGKSPEDRVEAAFRVAFGRSPSASERKLSIEFLQGGPDRLSDFALALVNANEFVYVD